MKNRIFLILIIAVLLSNNSFSQKRYSPVGVWGDDILTIYADSSFEMAAHYPDFATESGFYEKGIWTVKDDTLILNPHLTPKEYIQHDFSESEVGEDTNVLLTLNHIKRTISESGEVMFRDTLLVEVADYWFNDFKKSKLRRIAVRPTPMCAFAGYIPPETITSEHTTVVEKSADSMQTIHIGCWELRGTKEFIIYNPESNRLTLNIYSNSYNDGMIRSKKILIKNKNTLLTKRNKKGKFRVDIWTNNYSMLKRQK